MKGCNVTLQPEPGFKLEEVVDVNSDDDLDMKPNVEILRDTDKVIPAAGEISSRNTSNNTVRVTNGLVGHDANYNNDGDETDDYEPNDEDGGGDNDDDDDYRPSSAKTKRQTPPSLKPSLKPTPIPCKPTTRVSGSRSRAAVGRKAPAASRKAPATKKVKSEKSGSHVVMLLRCYQIINLFIVVIFFILKIRTSLVESQG